MADFPYSGITLIVRNAQKFFSDMGKANKAYDQSGAAAQRLKMRLDQARVTQERYRQAIESSQRKIDNLTQKQNNYQTTITRMRNAIDTLPARIKAADAAVAKLTTDLKIQQTALAITAKLVKKTDNDYIEQAQKVKEAKQALATAQRELNKLLKEEANIPVRKEQIARNEANVQATKNQIQDLTDLIATLQARFNLKGIDIAGMQAKLQGMSASSVAALSAIVKVAGMAAAAIGILVAAFTTLIKIGAKVVSFFINLAKTMIGLVVKGVNLVINAFKGLLNIVGKIISPITNFLKNIITIASGVALYDFIRGLIYRIKELGNEIWDTVAAFQMLEVRFKTIIANDIANNSIIPFTEAIKQAQTEVPKLFTWVKRLAVQSPFQTEDIATVMALGSAMGITLDDTKRLTVAIGNYNSALGLGDEVMWRIVYNLGQMLERGRLTGEEFRDLSRNLFPINEILSRMAVKAGTTTEELKALALSGGVPVNQFIEEFIALAEEKFPTAMKDLSATWQVFQQNLMDFIKVFVGIDIFGPFVDKISEVGSKMLDSLLQNRDLSSITRTIGETLLKVMEVLTPSMNAFTNAVGALFNALRGIATVAKPVATSLTAINGAFVGNVTAMNDAIGISSKYYHIYEGMSLSQQQAVTQTIENNRKLAESSSTSFVKIQDQFEKYRDTWLRASNDVSGKTQDAIKQNKDLAESARTVGSSFRNALVSILTFANVVGIGISKISNFISGLAQQIAGKGGMSDLMGRMAAWGAGIVKALADGIAKAIPYLIAVIMTIQRIISYWFHASVPRVAAGIDVWGQETMQAFADGMSAGIPAINGAAQEIQNAVTGTFKKKSASDLVRGSKEVSKSISDLARGAKSAGKSFGAFGNTLEETVKKVKKAAKGIAGGLAEWGSTVMAAVMPKWDIKSFGFFNDIASLAESFIRSFTNDKNQKDIVRMVADMRNTVAGIIEGVRTGMISVGEAARRIGEAVANGTNEFRRYATALFEVAAAQKLVDDLTKEIDKAQTKLNETTKYYDAILKGLNDQLTQVTEVFDEQNRLAEINAALATNLLTDEERKRLENEKQSILIKQQIRDVEEQKEVAEGAIQTQIDALQVQRDAAEQRLQIAQDELEVSKSLIEAQINWNDLVQELLELLKEAEKKLSGAANAMQDILGYTGGGATPFELPELELNIDWEKIIAEAETNAKSMWTKIDENFIKPWEKALGGEGGPMKQLSDAFSGLGNTIKGLLPNFSFTNWLQKLIDLIFGKAEPVTSLGLIIGTSRGGGLMDKLGDVAAGFRDLFDALSPLVNIGSGLTTVAKAIGDLAKSVGDLFSEFEGAGAKGGAFEGIKVLSEGFSNWVNINLGVLAVAMEAMAVSLSSTASALELIKKVVGFELLTALSLFFNSFSTTANIIQNLFSETSFSGMLTSVTNFVLGVIAWFTTLSVSLVTGSIIPDMWNAIKSWFLDTIQTISDGLVAPFATIQTSFDTLSTNVQATVKTMADNVKASYKDMTDTIVSMTNTTFTDVAATGGGDVSAGYKPATTGITSIIQKSLQSVQDKFAEVKKTVVADFTSMTEELQRLTDETFTVGKAGEAVAGGGGGNKGTQSIIQKIIIAIGLLSDEFRKFIDGTFGEFSSEWVKLRGRILDALEALRSFIEYVKKHPIPTVPQPPGGGGDDDDDNVSKDGLAQGGGRFIVPPGYPNDSFRLGLTSGEYVVVKTPSQMLKANQALVNKITNGISEAILKYISTPSNVNGNTKWVSTSGVTVQVRVTMVGS